MQEIKDVFHCLTAGWVGRVAGFAALVLLGFSPLSAQEDEPLMISDLLLSNNTGTAVAISWRTNKPTTLNQVFYGLDKNDLARVVADSTYKGPSRIHFVRLIWLNPNSTYYYRVRSDNLEYSISPSGVDSMRTFAQILATQRLSVYGRVTDQTNTALPGVLVRSFIKWSADSSMWYTVVTQPDGAFSMDFANYRRYNGSEVIYFQNESKIFLSILGETQGALKDSVLLTAEVTVAGGQQDLGTYELIDVRKRAMRGIVRTTTPVLANGRAASVVRVTVLDDEDNPVPNVELEIRPTGEGTTVVGPFELTDELGTAVGLVRSQVAQVKYIHIFNLTADSSGNAELDTVAQVDFVGSLTDLSQDTVPPLIYFATEMENTEDNVGPYEILASVVDNFDFKVMLLYTVSGNAFTDTVPMTRLSGGLLSAVILPDEDKFLQEIPGQAYNTIIKYFIMAVDSSGNAETYPPGMLTDPFALPLSFEILREGEQTAAGMGINRTTDAFSTTDPEKTMRIDTWITSKVGISSAVIKWRNISQSDNFYDVSMTGFGAHYWGLIPAVQRGSLIEYFIQAVDSTGLIERDRRRAPLHELYSYEVMALDPLINITYADTTKAIGTTDVRKTRHSVVVDLNGDTYPDVVNANYGEINTIYFYNTSAGRLEDVTSKAFPNQLPEKTTHVAVADVDADDDLDLIFSNEGQQSRLYLNTGKGSFDDVTTRSFIAGGVSRMPAETWSSTCVLADDFDGDGDIDLFFANDALSGQQNRLLLNDSLGVFRDFSQRANLESAGLDKSIWAVAGDVDGDKDVDIVVINRAQNHMLLVNNGHGVFQLKTVATGSAAQASGADLGDIDRDGDLDLVIAQTQTQQNELYVNNGRGTFTKDATGRLPAESDDTWGMKFFDADLDGYLDLYYINYGQPNRLLINNGLGYFSPAEAGVMPSWESYSAAAAVGDLNQDNQPDLYISEEDRRNTLIFSRTLSTKLDDLPSRFDLVEPADADTINTFSETFVWRASHSPDTTDAIKYNFFLSRDSLFSAENQFVQRQVADTFVTIEDLTDETLFWWKVTAVNSLGIPVPSNQVRKLMVQESYSGEEAEFTVYVNRNPVFTSFMNIYIFSSIPLSGDPVLTINLEEVPATRLLNYDIWMAHYQTSSGFLLTVKGTNLRGKTSEYTATLSAALASAGESTVMAVDGKAWLTMSPGAGAQETMLYVQSHPEVSSEKIKARAADFGTAAGLSPEDLAAIFEGDCYTFTSLDNRLKRSATVYIRGHVSPAGGGSPAICILDGGVWVPLPTAYDSQVGAYSAVTDRLGTYALRSTDALPVRELPRGFALAQNSPNPFNPSTRISYSVPEREADGQVRLNVYNLRGALAASLVDEFQGPGTYAVEWDGRDRQGRDLPSGVYFYRLESEDLVITRKMVLIR
ncbi:MAG: VCBS repeat-containing protein [Candidatus Glassbacteria bacterium]|nr:VCBS repeat-containing protein [Candidatus Glassbacteria bacterium]